MTARDELFLHLPDSLWLSKRDALIDAFREEVIAEVAVADGRVVASVGPAAQRDADRIGELERAAVEARSALGGLCYDLADPGTHALGALHLLRQATLTTALRPDDAEAVLARHDAEVRAESQERIVDLEAELAELRENYAELASRPTWTAAADVAEDVALTLHHHHEIEQENGAHEVVAKLREKAAEAGEGRG